MRSFERMSINNVHTVDCCFNEIKLLIYKGRMEWITNDMYVFTYIKRLKSVTMGSEVIVSMKSYGEYRP